MNPMTPGNYSPFTGGYNTPQSMYPYNQPSLSKFGPNPAPAPAPMPSFTKPLQGRVVSSYDDILMGDVPQDNSIALFPLEDYSCIYAKQWSKNGQGFDEIRYVPEPMTQKTSDQDSGVTLDQIMNRLDNLENLINQRIPKNNYKKNYRNNDRNAKTERTETEEN